MEDSARRTQQDLNLATRKAEQAGLIIYYSIFFVHFLIEDPIFSFPPFNFPLYFSATKETSNYCICEKMWKCMYIIYVYICKNHFFLDFMYLFCECEAWRRFQATQWLESLVGPLGISNQPSEKEFISCLRSGLILCNAINKIQPGSVPKVKFISIYNICLL